MRSIPRTARWSLRLDAVRAHLLEMTGDHQAAIEHYRIAAGRTTSIPEQNYLMTQAARLGRKKTDIERRTVRPNSEKLGQPECSRTAKRVAGWFLLGSHGVFIRAEHVSLPPRVPDMLSVRNEQLTEGVFTHKSHSLVGYSYPLQRTGRVFPARCPGRVLLGQVPFGQTPSLHPLRRRLPGLVRGLLGTVGLSDFPGPFIIGVRP